MKNKPVLSIVILSYNTRELTLNCLRSLEKVGGEVSFEVIVVDNASTDGSVGILQKHQKSNKKNEIIIQSEKNLGFAGGNNLARKIARGKYVLFLNSDTEVRSGTLAKTIEYMQKHEEVGAMTCKMVLPDGSLDRDARRSFPTPWVALTHFSGLDRLFPKSKLFAKYWYGYMGEDATHEVDVIQGAYFLTRKSILDKVGWFDEDYFLDGEDIDLSWRIGMAGHRIVYYPSVSILHVKKASKRKRERSVREGVGSMEIFYRKRMWNEYPLVVNWLVILGIQLVKVVRKLKK